MQFEKLFANVDFYMLLNLKDKITKLVPLLLRLAN